MAVSQNERSGHGRIAAAPRPPALRWEPQTASGRVGTGKQGEVWEQRILRQQIMTAKRKLKSGSF